MRLSISGVFADAGAMWRDHRDVLGAVTGVFFIVPILGLLLLMMQSGLAAEADPLKLSEAMRKFYMDHLLVLLFASLMIDFGIAAILILFLQPGERSLGDTLAVTLRRLLPFIAVNLIARILFSIGSSLFLLPGLFALARTWLVAPSLAAVPGQGMFAAFRQGWQRSDGFRWLVLLGAAAATVLAALFVILLGSVLLGLLGAAVGDNQALEAAGYVLIAVVGSIAWVMLTLVRVSAYGRTEPKQGI
ncbi:MAG: hypothetical protein EOP60_01960 [Sphingomonadales bacterium]|nr:MAG: hypothetical protein EOP60_01960 [Sphingomonadales bacterium]